VKTPDEDRGKPADRPERLEVVRSDRVRTRDAKDSTATTSAIANSVPEVSLLTTYLLVSSVFDTGTVRLDPLKVGVLEPRRILQPVAERARSCDRR
jgi:hypothetical protein